MELEDAPWLKTLTVVRTTILDGEPRGGTMTVSARADADPAQEEPLTAPSPKGVRVEFRAPEHALYVAVRADVGTPPAICLTLSEAAWQGSVREDVETPFDRADDDRH